MLGAFTYGYGCSKSQSAQVASMNVPTSYHTTSVNYSAVSACCSTSACSATSSISSMSGSSCVLLVDSGASTHICSQRKMFSSLRRLDHTVLINVADGRPVRALGVGDISLSLQEGTQWTSIVLRDVLFAPDLKMNLLSVSRLTSDQYDLTFDHNSCQITKKGHVV